MEQRIAIKRLSASDCTLFEAVFRTIGAGNQKSINLNADILTDQFYPSLAAAAESSSNEITIALSIYGPGAKGAHKLARKIIKGRTYKNWRLNGEFIYGPPDDASRYDGVQAGDLAIMAFKGEVSPTGMDLIIISQMNPVDAALHASLLQVLPPPSSRRSMIATTPGEIAAAAARAAARPDHPIYIAAADPEMEAALEDAAQGGDTGRNKLLTNKGGRKVSSSDFAKARAKAELTGQDGEGLIDGYLAAKFAAGEISRYTWVSAENAIAPLDFEIFNLSGARLLVDVKATGGPFDNVIHLSLSEIIQTSGAEAYHIYRVFELNGDGGNLQISDDIRPLARQLKQIHETHMPDGIRVDGFSVATEKLNWSTKEYVERSEDDEGA